MGGVAAFACVGCAGKAEHPPQIYQDGAVLTGTGTGGNWDSGTTEDAGEDARGDDASTGLGTSGMFEKCYSDVMMQESGTHGVSADPYFCFVTTMGNPAENSTARNFLTPIVGVSVSIDDMDQVVEARASAYWAVTVTSPTGQVLTANTRYTTSNNDGSAIKFRWDKGDCGTLVENGAFEFRELAWDATNKVTVAALDFEDHCGDLASLYGRVRLHTKIPP
jgi:hypothetical protein